MQLRIYSFSLCHANMFMKRSLRNECCDLVDAVRSAVCNPRLYYVMVLLAISAFVITEVDWIDCRGMHFLIVLFACISVIPEIE